VEDKGKEMKIKDMFFLSINALMHAKLRTWLTIIGIVIGIFVVVILFSLGSGVKEFIKERLAEFGSNTIEITPGTKSANMMSLAWSSQKGRLTIKDVGRVKGIVGVKHVVYWVMEKLPTRFKNKEIHCKLQDGFTYYVIDAKPGKYLDDKYLKETNYMPKEWKHGYTRGFAISEEQKVIIYWVAIW